MLAQDIDYEFLSSHTIKLKEPVKEDGIRITIRRDTDLRDRAVDFVNAAELTEADLDNSASQVFYAMQEAQDNSQDTISPDDVGNWDIHDRNVVNLRAGDKPHHAVNKEQLDKKDAKWNQLEQSMQESIETMGNQIVEAGEHVNTAQMAASEATGQASKAYTQADRAEDEADRAEEAQRQAAHSESNASDYEDQAAAYADLVREKHGEVDAWHHDVKNMHSNVTDNTREVRAKLDEVNEKRLEIYGIADSVERDLEKSKGFRNDALRYRDAASNSAANAKATEQTTLEKSSQVVELHGETEQMHSDVQKNLDQTTALVGRAEQAASTAEADVKKTSRDREAVSNLRDDVENRQNKVVDKHTAVQSLHDATKQYRDEAQLLAGKAENFLVDYGDWDPKLGLPPKPATSARWKARKGGEVEGLGVFRAGDWLNYSVVGDKFYREGNVLSVNGRTGDISLTHDDVGAFSRGQANQRFLYKDEKAVDSVKADNAKKLNGRADHYHPDNKPSAADVGALTANGKAVDASKLNGRADHYHPDNKPSASDVGLGNLSQGQNNELKITSAYGYVQVGGKNSGWCHFYTDLPKFYFDKNVTANGDVTLYKKEGTRLDHSSGNIYEHGKRVYSPKNKPSAADVGALPSNGKAKNASKLNGRSDYYHPDKKPSAADVGAYSKSQTYSKAEADNKLSQHYTKSEADEKFTVGYATENTAGLVRVKVSGDTLEIFTS